MIRVLLVDDDALVRSGLRMMLAGAANLDVVAEAGDGREVLGAVDLHRPDVVLMDIRMPQLDGIAATRLLAAQPDPPAIVVLTTFDADELVLREDGSESLTEPPQPTIADLPALVEESRAAGMRITARIELGDAAPPAAVGRTAYRIAQEGLTNARNHAPGAAVTLTVRAPDGDLQVEVRSLAPVAVAAVSPLPGAGTGLIGLTERVALAGGELEHGVDADGAFVVRARLPR